MHTHTSQYGYSLIEALVSIAVLLIAIVGPMTIASQGIKTAAFTLEQNTAFFLAQEGIEIITALRDDFALEETIGAGGGVGWDWLDYIDANTLCPLASGNDCTFGVYIDGTNAVENYVFSSDLCDDETNCVLSRDTANVPHLYVHNSSLPASPYTRVITIEHVDSFAVAVTSKVSWESRVFGGQTQTVRLETILFDQTTGP